MMVDYYSLLEVDILIDVFSNLADINFKISECLIETMVMVYIHLNVNYLHDHFLGNLI